MGETEGACRGNCLQVHARGSTKAHQSYRLFQLWVYAPSPTNFWTDTRLNEQQAQGKKFGHSELGSPGFNSSTVNSLFFLSVLH